jgi:hypothetical protein
MPPDGAGLEPHAVDSARNMHATACEFLGGRLPLLVSVTVRNGPVAVTEIPPLKRIPGSPSAITPVRSGVRVPHRPPLVSQGPSRWAAELTSD